MRSFIRIPAVFFATAGAVAAFESFDDSILNARGVLPNVVGSGSMSVVRRAEMQRLAARKAIADGDFAAFEKREADGPEDCGEGEEWVEYGDDGDDETDEPKKVDNPTSAAPVVKAVVASTSTSAPAPSSTAASSSSSSSSSPVEISSSEATAAATPVAASAAPASLPISALTTPANIGEGTYTVDEGCVAYHNVVGGEICLGLLDIAATQGFTTSLEDFYCLNPAVDQLCFNLQIDTSYCIAYSNGTVPLPSSK